MQPVFTEMQQYDPPCDILDTLIVSNLVNVCYIPVDQSLIIKTLRITQHASAVGGQSQSKVFRVIVRIFVMFLLQRNACVAKAVKFSV